MLMLTEEMLTATEMSMEIVMLMSTEELLTATEM